MPGPLDFLKSLDPMGKYKLPALTPQEQADQDEKATYDQSQDQGTWRETARHLFEGGMDAIKGIAGVDTVPKTPEGGAAALTPNGIAQLGMAALPLHAGIKGLYSRVNRVADALPETFTAGAAASKFKNAASQEEVEYRGLKDLLTPGSKKLQKGEVVSHLEDHPLNVEVTRLGEPADQAAFDGWYEQHKTYYPNRQEALDDFINRASFPPTKYPTQTLPGGQNYREDLITLKTPQNANLSDADFNDWHYKKYASHYLDRETPVTLDWLRERDPETLAQYANERNEAVNGPQFTQGHFDEPNVLAHVRHDERELPAARNLDADLNENDALMQMPWRDRARHIQEVGAQPEYQPQKGRFIEEVQSDWHQKGKREGYATPEQHAQLAAYDQQAAAADAAQEHARAAENDFYNHAVDQGNPRNAINAAVHEAFQLRHHAGDQAAADFVAGMYGPEAEGFWHRYQNAMDAWDDTPHPRGSRPTLSVPDAPFKESWPDLALKQQLLDVADRPDLSWMGFTSGNTQADRYNLHHVLERIDYHYDPQSHAGTLIGLDGEGSHVIEHTIDPESLPEYIGKEAADRLLRNVVSDQTAEGGTMHHQLTGQQLEVGGEGMKSFYDNLLPKRLGKILKPFGASVEPGELPGKPATVGASAGRPIRMPLDAPYRGGFTSHIYRGDEHVADTYPLVQPAPGAAPEASERGQELADLLRDAPHMQPKGTPIWMARLPPEVKKAIKEKGLPLLSLLGLGYFGGGDQGDPTGLDNSR